MPAPYCPSLRDCYFFTTGSNPRPGTKRSFNSMPKDQTPVSPIVKLALEKKLIGQKHLEKCQAIVVKSKKIGLDTTVEEVLVKQGVLSEEQLRELHEICQLTTEGAVFGVYRLGRLLGEGGMGKVYEAVHEIMGRSVAIKVIHPQITSANNNATRFYQEIRALAKLNHPNIVVIHDAGTVRRRHYYAMELLAGPSLKARVDTEKRLREKEALDIVAATARALGHAHAKKIVHRDVKPENIIFDENGLPKLTDFGLVMHQDKDHLTLTQEGYVVGSFNYASPEQFNGERDIDGRSDIYSLGATLYYALTGHTVYSGNSPQEIMTKCLRGRFNSPRRYSAKISGRTIRLLSKMLAVNREKRFQSMAEVIAAIEKPSHTRQLIFLGAVALAGAAVFCAGGVLGNLGLLPFLPFP
jgi:serine/threonine protein kinase